MRKMKDFTVDYRPHRFNAVWGNADIKRIIKGWILKDIRPNSIVLVGRCGIGKSTFGKLIAQRFNCHLSPNNEPEPCEQCDSCVDCILHPKEFDLTNLSVDEVRYRLRNAINLFNPETTFYWDEMQRWYMKNQEIFLKPIEEAERLHHIFSTTDIKAIDEAILSRSVVLEIFPPSPDEMVAGLTPIVAECSIKISEAVLRKLIKMSRNTPRKCLSAFNVFATMEVDITEETLESDLIRKMLLSE